MKHAILLVVPCLMTSTFSSAETLPLNDYPTEARADYVFGCMAVNGQTPDALRRCSCAIDVIATILDYDAYVSAETVLTMRQTSGERSTLFRDTAPANGFVADLRRAEAEAEIICF
jgi:hypothetical protein